MTFKIEIEETLIRVVEVMANDIEVAMQMVKAEYNAAENIVLDSSDFAGVEFNVI